jgi:serine/threonine-protein kinase
LNEDGAPFDSGFDDAGPFRVSPESGSVSLESALRDFGPAAIDDLIPRIRALAASLDAAHRAGVVHGALHPSKVFVTDDATSLVAGKGAHAPYAAPEVLGGHGATPKSDQYSLAAITYEWLFGRPLSLRGDRPIEFRAMPGVDRVALSKAFNRALSSRAEDRFARHRSA